MWGGAGDRDVPERSRRSQSRGDEPGAKPLTVEQLLARQDTSVGRRRAARREEPSAAHRHAAPAGARNGLPPVPSSAAPSALRTPPPQPGLPPVPPIARHSRPVSPLPPADRTPPPERTAGRHPSLPVAPLRPLDPPPPAAEPEVRRFRPSTPSTPIAPAGVPDVRSYRPSTPIPPLPGLAPPAEPRRRSGRLRPRPDRPPTSLGRRRLGRVVMTVVGLVALVALYHLGLYFYVDQKIDRVDALATDGAEILAPALQDGTETYLVVGTDVPGENGPQSVSVLLASVSADADRAALVSLPPTALVDTPMCRRSDGSLREPASEAFATALLDGGPSCLVRAVQQLSGLRVDHYLGVDLARLPGMVDALGGVSVCVLPTPGAAAAADPLPAGRSEVSGDAASGYLKPKDAASDVTGAGVAERAQLLLTSTLRAAMAPGTVANTLTLTRFLSRAADALTVDQQTTLGDLRVLASTLGDLQGDAVQRAALPVAEEGYVPAGNEEPFVLLDPAATRQLFDSVIDGTRVPDEILAAQAQANHAAAAAQSGDGQSGDGAAAAGPSAAASPAPEAGAASAPAGPPPLTVAPNAITLDVLNGTATGGLAGTVAEQLRGQGFTVGSVGNESGPVDRTVVRHGPNAAEQARTVAAAVPGAELQPTDGIDGVQLVIGPNYSNVVPVQVPPPGAAPATTAAADTSPAPAPAAAEPAPVSC
jgi:LCP family protein required for cell wall assembly